MVLVALVATPFLASVAQGRSAPSPKSDLREARHGDEQRGDDRRDKHGDGKCGRNMPTKAGTAGGMGSTTIAMQRRCSAHFRNVFFDLSYDGVRDAGEPGIENWFIMLTGPVNATTTTDAAGSYSFTGLPAGTYMVCESQRFGWMQTAPPTESTCASGLGHTIVITAGQSVGLLDFGNVG
jgi:hypothetical protein